MSPTRPLDHHEQAARIVAGLTLPQKASLCSGRDFWTTQDLEEAGVPAVTLTDGPHGVRLQAGGADHLGLSESVPATCFPTASALAASWDPDLIAEVGAAIALECRALGVGVLLGPGTNLKRTPLCGRNFEYFSEDPLLAAELATAFVTAVQAHGVGTSLKHLAGNDQETRRMTIDAVYDERTLRELELAAFEQVVRRAQPWTVMSAYNRLNGTYAGEHPWLLTEVLRDDWGFEGIVVTDWGATNDRVAGLAAGCDLQMPGTACGSEAKIVAAVEAGDLDVEVLDATAVRLVALALAAAANAPADEATPTPDATPAAHPAPAFDVDAHHRLARRIAADTVVLCRNERDALPIGKDDRVALIGPFATVPRFQGTGSSRINPTRVDTLAEELTALLGEDRVRVASGIPDGIPDGSDDGDHAGEAEAQTEAGALRTALSAAEDAEVVVVCVGLPDGYENEGNDRTHLRLPPTHDRLVAALAAAHDRVVVVLSNGAPVAMPWVHDVAAIVEGYLGGQAGAGGMADVLTGRIAPTGRLAETFPLHLDDVPAMRQMPGGPNTVEHREGLYVGYRAFTSLDAEVLFPFGHGLGYSRVEYGAPQLDRHEVTVEELAAGVRPEVSVELTNTGERDTREVVQVYVRDIEAAVYRPDRELAAFTKVTLAAGETRTVTLPLDERALTYWHPDTGAWTVEPGDFEVLVAASCTDVRGTVSLRVPGEPLPVRDEPAVYRNPPRYLDVDAVAYTQLLGRPLPGNPGFVRPYTHNTPIGEVADTAAGRALVWAVERQLRRGFGDDPANKALVSELLAQAPLRTLLMGGVTHEQLDVLVALVNGRWVRGGERVLRTVLARLRGTQR